MTNKEKCMLLIALECRLSLLDTATLFKTNTERIKEILDSSCLDRPIADALRYLFFYETVKEPQKREQKYKFLA